MLGTSNNIIILKSQKCLAGGSSRYCSGSGDSSRINGWGSGTTVNIAAHKRTDIKNLLRVTVSPPPQLLKCGMLI